MKIQKVLFLSGVLFCASFNAHAATLNVPSTYSTIQSAIDAAVSGDTVLVAPVQPGFDELHPGRKRGALRVAVDLPEFEVSHAAPRESR